MSNHPPCSFFSSHSARPSSALGQYFCLGMLTVFEPQDNSSLLAQQLGTCVSNQRQSSRLGGNRTALALRGLSGVVGPAQSGTAPNLCATSLQANEVPFRLLPTPYGQGEAHPLCDFAPGRQSPSSLSPRSARTRTRVPFV